MLKFPVSQMRLFLVFFLVAFHFTSFSQEINRQTAVLRDQALENYNSGRYLAAEADFRELMKTFPKDPLYRYYTGICLVETDRELEEAVELLYYSSSRGVPRDVYYYMGIASQKMYDFEKAEKYFREFDREGARSETRAKDSKLLIGAAENATLITESYNPFQIVTVTFINLYDPDQYSNIRMKGGVLSRKPDALFAESEDQFELNSLMFLPKKVETGNFVYFVQPSRKDGLQLMQAKKSITGRWTDIREISELNTPHNEILPYYDPSSNSLYFATDGRKGLGGFDLYHSHYDEERDEWSEPLHLGFPLNSSYDDYLALPGPDMGLITFFTGRKTNDSRSSSYHHTRSDHYHCDYSRNAKGSDCCCYRCCSDESTAFP